MTLAQIAEALLGHIRSDTSKAGIDALYAADAVSVEAVAGPEGRETRGAEAIKAKHDWWNANFEAASADVAGPFPHGDDRFALIFRVEARNRQTGEASSMEEVAVYHVAGGKIAREEFFYRA